MATGSRELMVEEVDPESFLKSDLRQHLLCTVQRPLVFRRCLDSWTETRGWSPVVLSRLLAGRETTFKVCPRRGSEEYGRRFGARETVFETQCEHVKATFLDFAEWMEIASKDCKSGTNGCKTTGCDTGYEKPFRKKLKTVQSSPSHDHSHDHSSHQSTSNPLLSYSSSQYWIYADYKYMSQLCDDRPELMRAIDWSVLGFEGRGGADSTLWVGSEGADTPCHYDTYGCNLVAQLWGRKKWTLFPPSDSAHLYPTRIPYEESSVFSEVNVECPDLERHPDFTSATGSQVVLEAGDVLFVPRHWWHYVECIEAAVSVNTWIDLPCDSYERVKEAVVRTMTAGWLSDHSSVHQQLDTSTTVQWINPNEEVFSHQQNLELLSMTISATTDAEHQTPPTQTTRPRPIISHRDWVKAITSDSVVKTIASTLMTNYRTA